MGETELDVARIRLRSAWKAVDTAQTPEQRQELFERADALQAEMIALESQSQRDDVITYTTIRPGDITFADITVAPADKQRELKWWQDQYSSKLSDTLHDNGRTPATVEELRYFEDKIRELGGSPTSAERSPWIEYHDALVKEWFDGERALINDLYPSPPAKPEEPVYRPFAPGEAQAAKIIGAFTLAVIVIFISTLYLWA